MARLYEPDTPLDPTISDNIRIVKVEGGGARCGCISVPECLAFDPQVNYTDRGIYSVISATTGEVPFDKFCAGIQTDYKVSSMQRLERRGYIVTDIEDGFMTVRIRDVIPYTPNKIAAGDLVSIHGTKKPQPDNKNKHNMPTNYIPYHPLNDEYIPINISTELWGEFIKFRKGENFSVKKAHVKRMKEQIEGYGRDGSDCVRRSIQNCWRGLFPLKGSGSGSRSTQILGEVEEQTFEDEL